MTYTYLPDPPDSAIKYIRRSIDAGWGRICEPGAIRFAPEYAFVRNDPRFRPYLEQIVRGDTALPRRETRPRMESV